MPLPTAINTRRSSPDDGDPAKIILPPRIQAGEGSQKSRDLDEELAAASSKYGAAPVFEYTDGVVASDGYRNFGSLTANEVIVNDYETTYARLQDTVLELKTWLQSILTEQARNEDIALARQQWGGPKYQEVKTIIDQLLLRRFSSENIASQNDVPVLMAFVTNEMLGLGPLEPLWQDKSITEIMVNGPKRVRIEIGGKLVDAKGVQFRDVQHLLDVCQQILAPLNRTIDVAHPLEDGRLPDGSRINVTHPVIGPAGPYLTIRRFPEEVFTVRRLVEYGSMSEPVAELLGNLIHSGCSIIVSGGTGSGKSSMLNALSGCLPENHSIITIEDNLELQLHPRRDVRALEARKARGNSDRGSVSIGDLVKNALRMRPDFICIGEIRDGTTAESVLQAAVTGHPSASTIHANTPDAAIDRLVNLVVAENTDANSAMSLIANGIDLIVQVSRFEDGSRRVTAVSEIPTRLSTDDGRVNLKPVPLWEFVQTDEDADGRVIGEYVQRNEISETLVKSFRLDRKKHFSAAEIIAFSDHNEETAIASPE